MLALLLLAAKPLKSAGACPLNHSLFLKGQISAAVSLPVCAAPQSLAASAARLSCADVQINPEKSYNQGVAISD